MKLSKNKIIIGGLAIAIVGYWMYNRYRSRKAIEKAKEDELAINTSTQPEIPKMYIVAGTNIPAGAMSFVDDKK